MRSPNYYPSATNVRFTIICFTSSIMVIWYGYSLPINLSFVNFYKKSPLSMADMVFLVVLFWIFVFAAYSIHQFFLISGEISSLGICSGDALDDAVSFSEVMDVGNISFVVDDNISSTQMMAYGFPFRRRVRLGKGSILYRKKYPEKFRAKLFHELAHIKNGDVDTGFISLSAIYISYLLISSVLVYWTVQFILNFRLLEVHGLAYFTFWRYGVPFYGGAVAWLVLLWIENRSFIRQREFMADAEAAFRIGEQPVISALGGDGSASPRLLWGEVKELLSFHPRTQTRVILVQRWQRAGLPTAGVVMVVGFMWGIYISVSNALGRSYPSHAKFLDWEFEKDQTGWNLADILLSDNAYFFVFAFVSISSLPIIASTLEVSMRFGMQCRALGDGFIVFSKRIIAIGLLFFLSYIFGQICDPSSLEKIIYKGDFSISKFGFSDSYLSLFFIFVAYSAYFFANFIMNGKRSGYIPQFEWFLLALTFSLIVQQFLVSIFFIVSFDFRVNLLAIVVTFGMVMFYIIAFLGMLFRIRNGENIFSLRKLFYRGGGQ